MKSNIIIFITFFFQPPVRDALDAFIFQRVYMDRENKGILEEKAPPSERTHTYPPQGPNSTSQKIVCFFGLFLLVFCSRFKLWK